MRNKKAGMLSEFILSDVFLSPGSNFSQSVQATVLYNNFGNYTFEITAISPRDEWAYYKTSNISRILVSNKIVDNSDVVGAPPVGAAPTTSSFST